MSIFTKQKKVGMSGKVRLRREVEADYQKEALKVGHKSRMILEHQRQIEVFEREVEEGLALMQKLDNEFKNSLPDPTPEPNPPTGPQTEVSQ